MTQRHRVPPIYIATPDLQHYHVSRDMVRALTGFTDGYRVTLHALPGRTFYADAATVDEAQRLVLQVVRRERPTIASGANIQAR